MVTTDDPELSLCVEIVVDDQRWVEQLPPAPASGAITVSFDDVELAARDRTAVVDLGYVVVGTGKVRNRRDVAHLLVPTTTVRRHERWWSTLLELAGRVYDLRFGPVQLALAEVLRAHASATGNGSDPAPTRHAPARRRPSA